MPIQFLVLGVWFWGFLGGQESPYFILGCGFFAYSWKLLAYSGAFFTDS